MKEAQVRQGMKVEAEHKGTFKFIRGYEKSHHHLPSDKAMEAHIAIDHLKEHGDYYKRLKRAKL